jgi:hypothetical protein
LFDDDDEDGRVADSDWTSSNIAEDEEKSVTAFSLASVSDTQKILALMPG